ncbi:hypothetical protein C8J57DRAFT_1628963 [Mycena rebaudengoi]|nr:hypothetical protein C8J57DRAFT_1628963 [Mycena rebaudengoi]
MPDWRGAVKEREILMLYFALLSPHIPQGNSSKFEGDFPLQYHIVQEMIQKDNHPDSATCLYSVNSLFMLWTTFGLVKTNVFLKLFTRKLQHIGAGKNIQTEKWGILGEPLHLFDKVFNYLWMCGGGGYIIFAWSKCLNYEFTEDKYVVLYGCLSLQVVYRLGVLGLPPVPVTATAVDSTATRRQRAVEQRPVGWVREFLTGRYGQRHGRSGLLTGPRVEKILFEQFYGQKWLLIEYSYLIITTQMPKECKEILTDRYLSKGGKNSPPTVTAIAAMEQRLCIVKTGEENM